MTALHEARLQPDVYDDDDILLPLLEHSPHAALRLPDGRAMAWAEYGSSRGLPCVLIPDTGSSRLAPGWLLHDSALPAAIRLLAIDRPGIGASDPIAVRLHSRLVRSICPTIIGDDSWVVCLGRPINSRCEFAVGVPTGCPRVRVGALVSPPVLPTAALRRATSDP